MCGCESPPTPAQFPGIDCSVGISNGQLSFTAVGGSVVYLLRSWGLELPWGRDGEVVPINAAQYPMLSLSNCPQVVFAITFVNDAGQNGFVPIHDCTGSPTWDMRQLSPAWTGKIITLLPHELATQLAFLLTGGPPDAELSAAADSGALAGADGREAQARRLLALPGARNVLSTFAAQWFELAELGKVEKDATAFPTWSTERPRILSDAQAFFTERVLDQSAGGYQLFGTGWCIRTTSVELGKDSALQLDGPRLQIAPPASNTATFRWKYVVELVG